jgi:hypothetical protein
VAAKKFHIWPISRIEQGIELLTGLPTGERNGDGKFATGTVFSRMDDRLIEMARTLKEFN